MKDNVFDEVLNGLNETVEEVSNSIARDFKGVKPFDKIPLTMDEQLYEYNQLTQLALEQMIQTQGLEATKTYVDTMEAEKAKRGLNA